MADDDGPEDLSEWTVARMEALFTPQDAARIKYQVAALRLCTDPDEHIDRLLRDDPGHQMFVYCMDAVARRAPDLTGPAAAPIGLSRPLGHLPSLLKPLIGAVLMLPWLLVAAVLLLPVILRIWGEESPDNGITHHSDDGSSDEDPELQPAA